MRQTLPQPNFTDKTQFNSNYLTNNAKNVLPESNQTKQTQIVKNNIDINLQIRSENDKSVANEKVKDSSITSYEKEFTNQDFNQSKNSNFKEVSKEFERRSKQTIFDKLFQENTTQLLQSYMQQEIQSKKKQIRKFREDLQENIKQIQQKVKEKKKIIEKQKEKNRLVATQIHHQFAMFQRLNKIETMTIFSGLDNYSNYKNNEANQQNLDNQISSYLNIQDTINNEDSIYDLPTGKIPLDSQLNSIFENKVEVTGIYQFFIEKDLSSTKQRTLMQLQNIKGKNDASIEEQQVLLQENQMLQSIIKRYQKMIKQAQINIDKGYPIEHVFNGDASPHSGVESNKIGGQNKSNSFKIADIEDLMYKYQRHSKNDSSIIGTKSIVHNKGSVGSETPKINLGVGFQSQNRPNTMSFGIARSSTQIDIRKVEQLNLGLLHVSKSFKAIDSIVMLLQMVKTVLKAAKVCLFIIEPALQERLFSNRQRRHNYSKILVGTSNVLQVYNNKEDIQDPLFKQIDQVTPVMNQKNLLLPLWDPDDIQIPQQCLQIYFEEKKINPTKAKKTLKNVEENKIKSKSKSPDKSVGGNLRAGSNSGSRISLSTQQKVVGVQGSLQQGCSQNDLSLSKLMVIFIQLNSDYFNSQVVKAQKEKKIIDVINFAIKMIQVRSYRQLVKEFTQNVQQLLGFSAGTIFFQNSQNNDLFTVANHEIETGKNDDLNNFIDTSFAKELYFPDDQIVIFPSSIGITGDVHRNMGLKIDNDFGIVVKKSIEKDDEFDLQSDISVKSLSKIHSRKSSLNHYQQQQFLQGFKGNNYRKETKLEYVIEEDPQAEHDIQYANNQQTKISKKNSTNDLKHDQFDDQDKQVDKSNKKQKTSMSSSPQQHEQNINYSEGLSFGLAIQQADLLKNSKNTKKQRVNNLTKNINQNKSNVSYQPFVPDIDNFAGIKQLKNYCIISLKDNGYSLGETSVGVLQLFNKIDGRRINKEDLARIKNLSKFIGALSQKAQAITNSLTLVIGMTQRIKQENYEIFNLDTTPGMGVYQSMVIPTETILKAIELEQKIQKDQQQQTMVSNQ